MLDIGNSCAMGLVETRVQLRAEPTPLRESKGLQCVCYWGIELG